MNDRSECAAFPTAGYVTDAGVTMPHSIGMGIAEHFAGLAFPWALQMSMANLAMNASALEEAGVQSSDAEDMMLKTASELAVKAGRALARALSPPDAAVESLTK